MLTSKSYSHDFEFMTFSHCCLRNILFYVSQSADTLSSFMCCPLCLYPAFVGFKPNQIVRPSGTPKTGKLSGFVCIYNNWPCVFTPYFSSRFCASCERLYLEQKYHRPIIDERLAITNENQEVIFNRSFILI